MTKVICFIAAKQYFGSSKKGNMETQNIHEHLEEAKSLLNQGYDMAYIEAKLKQKNLDESSYIEILHQLKRFRNSKRTKNGTILVLIGVILLGAGFISCIAIHLNGGSVGFSLYGLTTIGAIVLTIGLVLIFS